MREIVLASQSPRRQELIRLITEDFSVMVPEFDESEVMTAGLSPRETVEQLALGKARAARDTFGALPERVYLGGDTVVVSPEGEIMGKPRGREDAVRMLKGLSGRTHHVITGVALVGADKERSFSVCTDVTFFELTDEEIGAYADTAEPYDKAGAYGIQLKGGLFVEKIHGDYTNVVGLPIAVLSKELQKF